MVFSGLPNAQLISDPRPPFPDSTVCSTVEMTCTAQDVTFLSWFYNNHGIVSFANVFPVQFPYTLHNESGILIQLIGAAPEAGQSDVFNSTSVLTGTTTSLDMLGVDSISCGTVSVRSDSINLTPLMIQSTL